MFQAMPVPYAHQHPPSPPIDIMAAMPPHHPSAAMLANPPDQKPRKLRASCDACSRAKVKCDKVRPTCQRCGNMSICCNYSPSMRLGKPRKPRNPDGSIIRDVSPASSCGPLGPRPDMIPRTASSVTDSSPEPMDPYMFGPATPEPHYPEMYVPGLPVDGSQSPYSDAGSFANNWSGDDMMFSSPPTEPLFTSMMPQFHPPPPSPFGHHHHHVRSSSVHSQPEPFHVHMEGITQSPPMSSAPFFGMDQQQPLPSFLPPKQEVVAPPAPVQAPLPTPPASATLHSHDCTQIAFSTLNSLCSPPSRQPAHGDFGAVGCLPTLDTVLSTNKSAIDRVCVLLSCHCSTNPHFSTTVAFTIEKILAWYQAVAGMHQPPTESPVVTQMESFAPPPQAESADEYLRRTQHILNELRRVEKLVDKFAERYCKHVPASENNGIDGGVYGALEQLLRTRVRDTFKVTMKHAPEEVKRHIASKTQTQRVRANTAVF